MNLKDLFSNQEIDIFACLLNDRSVKNTALLLGVAPKTVEKSLSNLLLRLQCSSLEQLKDMMAETCCKDYSSITLMYWGKRLNQKLPMPPQKVQ